MAHPKVAQAGDAKLQLSRRGVLAPIRKAATPPWRSLCTLENFLDSLVVVGDTPRARGVGHDRQEKAQMIAKFALSSNKIFFRP